MTPQASHPPHGRRIKVRVLSLVGVGMLGPLAVMAWAGLQSSAELERRVLSERQLLARLIAERLERVLSAEMESLQALVSAQGLAHSPELATWRGALREQSVRRHALFEQLFLVDAQGRVLVQEPAGSRPLEGASLLAEVATAGRPLYSDLVADSSGARRLYALVPLRGRPDQVLGLVGAAIDPMAPRLTALLASAALGEGESIDLIDGRGIVVASSERERIFRRGDHARFLADLLRDRRSASGTCHGCHEGTGERVREVFAFSPLSHVRWGITVRQPENAAYAFAGALSHHVALGAVALFAIAVLFAYGASLSVTRPLGTLNAAAQRFAQGALDEPIPPLPDDEVGLLGQALEKMRAALKDSLERVELANRTLEARVEARTAELVQLNKALEERERARALALRKAISAQEDERRRIARELHDETSQVLAAMAMGLESGARATLDLSARRRLEDASKLAARSLNEIKRLIMDLRPSVLDDLGLQAALEWCADRTLRQNGVAVRCEFSGLEARLPSEVETTLFRCAQEAMTNIARHSQAESVLLQCYRRGAAVALEIEDCGRGFDTAALDAHHARARGFGLLGIRERVELLGGKLQIESAVEQGTRIALVVPIRKEPGDGEHQGADRG